jgi:hypothetical protein
MVYYLPYTLVETRLMSCKWGSGSGKMPWIHADSDQIRRVLQIRIRDKFFPDLGLKRVLRAKKNFFEKKYLRNLWIQR